MFKLIRIFIGTALGLWIAAYFVGGFSISGLMTYFWSTLIVMAAVIVLGGLHS